VKIFLWNADDDVVDVEAVEARLAGRCGVYVAIDKSSLSICICVVISSATTGSVSEIALNSISSRICSSMRGDVCVIRGAHRAGVMNGKRCRHFFRLGNAVIRVRRATMAREGDTIVAIFHQGELGESGGERIA